MSDTINILRRAARTFRRYDVIKEQIRELEEELRTICRDYDETTGSRGLRVESLRGMVKTYVTPTSR